MTSPASLTMRQESACNHQIVKTLSLAVWEHQDGVEVPLLVCALTPLQYTSNLGGNSVPLYPFSSENKSHTAVLVPLCTITLAGMNVMPTMKLRLASQQISLPGRPLSNLANHGRSCGPRCHYSPDNWDTGTLLLVWRGQQQMGRIGGLDLFRAEKT